MGAVSMGILQFSLIYVLLLVVLFVMNRSKIHQSKLLVLASVRMTVQLVLVGFILTYIFANPRPIYTILFIVAMMAFSIQRVLSSQKGLNFRFKIMVSLSFCISGLFVLCYFVIVVVRQDIFNPQYTIPLAGMIMGNAMTGITLGLKSFMGGISTR